MSMRKHSEETKNKMRIAHKGKHIGGKNNNWKGGRNKDVCGYIRVCLTPSSPFISMTPKTDNIIFEHRLVVAKHLGRCLESWEMVHHINSKKDDNHLENLILVIEQKYHLSLHESRKIKTIDIKEYFRQYQKNNREELNKYRREWYRKKQKVDNI